MKKHCHNYFDICRLSTIIFAFAFLIACSTEKQGTDGTGESSTTKSAVLDTIKIQYTNNRGESYPEIAVRNQALVTFYDEDEELHRSIIEECGGKIIESYPLLDCYLVETPDSEEMGFISKVRSYPEVYQAYLNSISELNNVKAHFLDFFILTGRDVVLENMTVPHGDYCYEAALSAYPEKAENITGIKHGFDHNIHLTESNQNKFLNDIFYSTHPDSLILINMSYGPRLSYNNKPYDDCDKNLQKNWAKRYVDRIEALSYNMVKLKKHNPNFIIFKVREMTPVM